ncbi:MAG TPA: hypothetical protein VF855_11745 [Acidimicrobiales bacterium]
MNGSGSSIFVVRVWLPDRPGALGQVASRIGAVRGDVVGIEILERGAERAVDELLVALPDAALVDLLVAEMTQVDGVDVEDVRPLRGERHDPGIAALDLASQVMACTDDLDALVVLVRGVARELDCDWAAVVDLGTGQLRLGEGEAPEPAWLAAFVEGARHLPEDHEGDAKPHDLAWVELERAGLALVVGRAGRPFRWRERRQLTLLGRITDTRS